jgi:hypothetical protein
LARKDIDFYHNFASQGVALDWENGRPLGTANRVQRYSFSTRKKCLTMTPMNISQNPPNGKQPAWVRSVKVVAIVQMCLFAVAWMGFGVFAFCMVHRWGIEYDRKMEMVRHGQVKSEPLRVMGISPDKDRGGWNVSLGKDGTAVAWRSDNKVDDLRVGGDTAAYRFGDEYLIPRFDRGGHHWGKWIFLAFGMLPLPVAGGALLLRKLRSG